MHDRKKCCGVVRSATTAAMGVVLACGLLTGREAAGEGQLRIALVDAEGNTVKQSTSGKLELNREYVKGDRIVITGTGGDDMGYGHAPPLELVVKVDQHYPEAILFAPKKTVPRRPKVEFPIPLWQTGWHPEISPHPPKAFQGEKHVVTARVATEKEVDSYRNLALNPMDPRGTSTFFPHASSNSEWGDAAIYAARNAIDGFVDADGDHHSWPRQSWGPYLPEDHPDPQLLIEFGRPVEIDKLIVVVRKNDSQYNHWKEATVEFSDGSKVKIEPKYNAQRQEFPIEKRVVTSMRITSLVPDTEGSYAAFVEVEAWGKPAR